MPSATPQKMSRETTSVMVVIKGFANTAGSTWMVFAKIGMASHDFCHDHCNGDRNGNGQRVKEGIFVAEDQTVDQLQFRKAYDTDGDRHEHRDAQFLPDDFQDVSRPYFVERHASDHGNGCLAARIAARTHDHGHARHKQGP